MPARMLAAGIDLGGTKVAAGIFADDGGLVGRIASRPARADGPAAGTIDSLVAALGEALGTARADTADLHGIGVGSTGPLDPRSGLLLEAASLPHMFHFPLVATLRERFGRPVELTNDANAFALSEALFGAGRGETIVLGITLGTGCGVGVAIGGRLLEGASANAGEVYRALVGELSYDAALSGPGLERLYRERTGASRRGAEITGLADGGDVEARSVLRDFGALLARGLGVLAAAYDPGVMVLGGSVSGAFTHFGASLKEEIRRYLAPSAAARMRIVPSEQGAEAGPRGGAALVFSPGRLD